MMPAELIPFAADEPMPPGGVYRAESPARRLPGILWRFAWRNRHTTIPLAIPGGMLAAGGILASQHPGLMVPGMAALTADVIAWTAAGKKWDDGPRFRGWRWTSEVAYARGTE